MLLSNKKLLLLLVLGFLPFVGIISGRVESHEGKITKSHAITPVDQLINVGQNQLNKIRICLHSISALIKKNKNHTEKEQEGIINHFIQLDGYIIENLKNEKFISVNLHTAYSLLQMNNVLVDHINTLLNTNFKEIKTFKIEQLFTRAATKPSNLNPEQILARLVNNNKKLDTLTKKALGLKWYNKVSRFF